MSDDRTESEQVVALKAELGQALSRLETLQQENDRLRQSEGRYRQIFENAPISMVLISTQGVITEVNPACERLFETTVEGLSARSIFERPELVENGTLPYMLRAFAGEAIVELPTHYDAERDGGVKFFGQGHYAPIRDESGIVREIVEITPDMSALFAAKQALQDERDRAAQERAKLLVAIAQVANRLLRSPNYTAVLTDLVRLLGEAADSDRCCVTQDVIHPELNVPAVQILVEWCRDSVPESIDSTPDLATALPWDNLAQFRQNNLQGVTSNFSIDDLQEPARSIFLEQGLSSILVVPIMVQGESWGQIGFDNCGESRLYDEAEIATLRIAADSVAAAIERQQKDAELRKSEALYRSLFEISNEGIYRWELDRPIPLDLPAEAALEHIYQHLYVSQGNDAYAKMYGFSSGEDIKTLYLKDAYVSSSAKNLDFIRAWIANNYSIRNAESEEIDTRGKKRYFLNSVISFTDNEQIVGGWGTQIDITELRETQQALLQAEQDRSQELERLNTELQQSIDRLSESEERYRTLFEISSEGIYRFEFDRPIPINLPIDEQVALVYEHLFMAEGNKTYQEMYGFENAEEFNGVWLRDFHIQDSEQNQNFMYATVKNGYQIRNYESEEVDRHGNPRYFINNVSTMIKDGEAIGGWASQLDITELRLAQQSLLAAEQQRVAELAKTNQALKNSLDRLAADPDLNSFLGHVILEIIQQLNLYTAWVELYEPTTQTLQMHLLVERGTLYSKPHIPEMEYLTAGYVASKDTAWNVLHQTKQPLVISLDAIPQFFSTDDAQTLRQWGEQFGIQCGINILLMLGDEPLGLLVLFSTERTAFTQEELELAQALAQQATLAISIARLAEESRQLAIVRDRNHLAREIHDTLAQGYAGILMQIQAAHVLREQSAQAKHHLDCASNLARESIADARRSVWLLQQDSQSYSDVSGIIVQLVEQMAIGATPKPTVEIVGTPRQITPDLGMHLLRITQESLNNALRHARSNTVRVHLNYTPQQLQIAIEDDGCGFETALPPKGFGLSGMQQRADIIGARLQIQSQPDRGTQITLSLPFVM